MLLSLGDIGRFWSYVKVTSRNHQLHDEWVGPCNSKGYGFLRIGGRGGRNVMATWISFYLRYGTWPKCQINHVIRCNWPACVYWRHFYDGTQKQNMDDAIKVGNHASLNLRVIEFLRKMSAGRTGESNPNFGKSPSEYTRRLISNSMLGKNAGENNPSSVVLESGVKEIFLLRKAGWYQWEIANKVGLSQTQVSRILRGDRWGHLGVYGESNGRARKKAQ